MQLQHYIEGKWVNPSQEEFIQRDASTGAVIGACSTEGLDFGSILDYGRKVGGPALRKMSFRERGLMLKKLALHLNDICKKFSDFSGIFQKNPGVQLEKHCSCPVLLVRDPGAHHQSHS